MSQFDQKVKKFFATCQHLSAVYLFGSQATQQATSKSDADIAILFEAKQIPDFCTLNQMRCDLEKLLHVEVDLVILNKTNPILTHQILKKGVRILVKNQKHLSSFITRALSDYEDIKRLRSSIEHRWIEGALHG